MYNARWRCRREQETYTEGRGTHLEILIDGELVWEILTNFAMLRICCSTCANEEQYVVGQWHQSEKHRERRRVMVAVFDLTMARKICQDKCLCTVNGMKPMWRVKQTNLHLLSLLSRSQTINSDALLTVRCIKRKKKAMVLVATEQIQHIVSTCSALISCFVTWFHGIARLHTILALTFAAPFHASCLLCVRVAFPVRRVATSVELGPPTESVSVPNWLVGFNRSNDGRWFSWRLWKRRGYC